jgi:hypothetical protein
VTPTVAQTVDYLARTFHRQPFAQDVYRAELADCPPAELAAAVRSLIRTSAEWVPSIGLIRAEVAERLLALPSEREAVAQVDARIEYGRSHEGTAPELHALVKEAVNHVGGWYSLRNSDRPEVVRGQLLRYYRDARAGLVRECAAKDFTKR